MFPQHLELGLEEPSIDLAALIAVFHSSPVAVLRSARCWLFAPISQAEGGRQRLDCAGAALEIGKILSSVSFRSYHPCLVQAVLSCSSAFILRQ